MFIAKIDEIKEFIGFLKAVFITAIVIMSSLVAYLYKQPIDNNITVLIALVLDIIVIIGLYKRILKEIKSLRSLK
ncbi:hypothetical protein [Sulfurimonas sp.]